MNEFIEYGSDLEYAEEALEAARRYTTDWLSDKPAGTWPQVEQAQAEIDKALEAVKKAKEVMQPMIDTEEKHIDHLADLADAASY